MSTINKKCKIVMLPTEDESNLMIRLTDKGNKHLGNFLIYDDISKPKSALNKTQHLYITSDDEIKEGDWYLTDSNNVFNCEHGEAEIDSCKANNYRKIIATTDPKLHTNEIFEEDMHMYKKTIPQVQQSFLKEYVTNPNGEWEVEYELFSVHIGYKLKLNQDNIVNITSVKKKVYSKEELIDKLTLFNKSGSHVSECQLQNWIKENL